MVESKANKRLVAESTSLFAPLVRQYSPLLHESKYFPNVRHASLYTHSSGPYLPSPASPFASSGSRLQLFLDPTCHHEGSASDVAIEIKVDVWATLGSLVMRYRMAAVAFPFSLVMLVVSRQLREYNAGSESVPHPSSHQSLIRKSAQTPSSPSVPPCLSSPETPCSPS